MYVRAPCSVRVFQTGEQNEIVRTCSLLFSRTYARDNSIENYARVVRVCRMYVCNPVELVLVKNVFN